MTQGADLNLKNEQKLRGAFEQNGLDKFFLYFGNINGFVLVIVSTYCCKNRPLTDGDLKANLIFL